MPANNKIVLGTEVLIDLTDATIGGSSDSDKILAGYTAYGADGTKVTGTSEYDVDSSGVTATVSEVLATKTFAKNGAVLIGTMPNVGGQIGVIEDKDDSVAILQGYHDGSGSVEISMTERAKLIPSNIKSGVIILGVIGEYSGEGGTGQSKTITPTLVSQTVLPDTGYDFLTQVIVNAIPVTRVNNAYGGVTITIAGV